jgi:Amt family ammonium transporter
MCDVEALVATGFTEEQATAMCDSLDDLKSGVNSMWLILCGALVFIMHGGFAMVRGAGAFEPLSRAAAFAVCTFALRQMWTNGAVRACICNACVVFVPVSQLCAGAIRSKNTLNILLMTILDACMTGIMFYTVG